LLGTDLGPYGKDIGTDLVTLLHEMIQEKGDYTIRIRNIEPNWLKKMFPQLKEILKSKKISFIGIPIESGNNDILKAMRRGYKIEDVKECVKQLNQEFPSIFIRTQLMTGFPGETLEQFYDSYHLVDELFFDYVEVYPFSPRPDTPAAQMENTVPTIEAVRRRNKLWYKALLKNTPQRIRKILKN
jgi:threonylcarbamoyladenosine tRNA methylthiotransferase MtaB